VIPKTLKALIAVATLAALSACGNVAPATPGGATPFPANQGQLNQIADAIASAGIQQYPESFAGVAVDTDENVVMVWRKESPAFDQYISQQPWHRNVRLNNASHSHADLAATLDRLRSDFEYWKARGIVLHELGSKPDGSCVDVGVENPTEAVRELAAHYGQLPICVRVGAGRAPLAPSRPSTSPNA
jgi:hypothetical protein